MTYYYICDACGSIVTITDEAIADDSGWECADCGSSAMWEFTDEEKAMAHSRHIHDGLRSGLFRRARGASL
jgi:DNA-directed RNA polymerase subunit RPC12/RpoP